MTKENIHGTLTRSTIIIIEDHTNMTDHGVKAIHRLTSIRSLDNAIRHREVIIKSIRI